MGLNAPTETDMPDEKNRLPPQKNPPNSDDGVLESIGKAVADPVKTGAEDEELQRDQRAPDKPDA